jgi:hypothetical protein
VPKEKANLISQPLFNAGNDLLSHTRVARAPSPAKSPLRQQSRFWSRFVEHVHSSLTEIRHQLTLELEMAGEERAPHI